jgi:hypothetical protein
MPNTGIPRLEHPAGLVATGVVGGGRVAGAVGEEDPVGLDGEHVVDRGRGRRQHVHLACPLGQARGVIDLMPRSTAATVKRPLPHGRGTTYGSGVVTSPRGRRPTIGGLAAPARAGRSTSL